MSYGPKPKKQVTQARVAEMAVGWKFFPLSEHAKIVRSVTSAIDAYHRQSRPDTTSTQVLRQAGLPIFPRKPRRGRPPNPHSDLLVGRLAFEYAKRTDKLSARSWDLAEPTDFERFVIDVFWVAGIRQSAKDAIARYVKKRNRLPDIPDLEAIFPKPLFEQRKSRLKLGAP